MDRIVHEASSLADQFGTEHLEKVAEKLGMAVFYLLDTEHLKEAYFPELKAVALQPGLPGYERRYLLAHALGPWGITCSTGMLRVSTSSGSMRRHFLPRPRRSKQKSPSWRARRTCSPHIC